MSPDHSADEPLIHCPTCDLLLRVHTVRQERDADGKAELVYTYHCFLHSFFTFRKSTGLTEGH